MLFFRKIKCLFYKQHAKIRLFFHISIIKMDILYVHIGKKRFFSQKCKKNCIFDKKIVPLHKFLKICFVHPLILCHNI